MAEKNCANETRPRGTMRFAGRVLTFAFAILLLSACGGVTPVPTAAPTSAPTLPPAPTSTPRPEWTTPHPILSDVHVRRAIAYCTDKDALIESVYPYLTPEQRESLVMDSFVPREHWAYAGEENIEIYPFDPQKGINLLEEAGWKLPKGGKIRVNANDEYLSVRLATTSANFRQIWTAAWIDQIKSCGIHIERYSSDWWDLQGGSQRNFELKTFADVITANPRGQYYYACDHIPLSSNGWLGWNYAGWCNPLANENIIRANHTFWRQERIDAYRIVQQEFTKDMVSLPLFKRAETYAMNPELEGVEIRSGDWHYTWNIINWEIPGRDSITIGFTQEPYSLFTIIEDAYVANLAASLIEGVRYTSQNYEFLPVMQTQLPTFENGLTTRASAIVQHGDWIVNTEGDIVQLFWNTKLINSDGNLVTYKDGSATMTQLVVTYEFADGLTWSDGVPVTKADYELYYKIACDKDLDGLTLGACESIQSIDFSDNGYTITWIPGWQDAYYSLAPFGFYPAHRRLSDGTLLAELPALEWYKNDEIAKSPIGAGPYVLKEWIPGDRMVFDANPYYYGEMPKTKTIIIKFLSYGTAEANLILGDIDFIDGWSFYGVSDSLQAAEREGLIKIVIVPSSTWEHIDMNLYIK